MQDIFPSIIGQEAAKKRLSFYVENYASSRFVPNMLFIAPRGCGKTTLAKALAKNLVSFEKDSVEPKDYIEINCGQIRNLKHFLTVIITRYVHDKEVTLLFDEASELPQDVQMGLLTMVVDYSSLISDSSKIRSSTGIALDIVSPIGPLSFTYSIPLSKASTDKEQNFTFNIGSSF